MTNLNTANLKRLTPVTGRMLIGGELVESSGGNWIDSINPATGEVIGKVPRATAVDVERAVDAAEAAQTRGRRYPWRSARNTCSSWPTR